METAALTRGSIPPQLVSLALPLIFGNILQQLYNTIDAMVIGRFAGEIIMWFGPILLTVRGVSLLT